MTDVVLKKIDVYGNRLLSIPEWDSIPNGSVFTKKDNNTLEFVEPLADGTIGLQAFKSITITNGVLTGKGAAITPIADGSITIATTATITTVNGIITAITPAS